MSPARRIRRIRRWMKIGDRCFLVHPWWRQRYFNFLFPTALAARHNRESLADRLFSAELEWLCSHAEASEAMLSAIGGQCVASLDKAIAEIDRDYPLDVD